MLLERDAGTLSVVQSIQVELDAVEFTKSFIGVLANDDPMLAGNERLVRVEVISEGRTRLLKVSELAVEDALAKGEEAML